MIVLRTGWKRRVAHAATIGAFCSLPNLPLADAQSAPSLTARESGGASDTDAAERRRYALERVAHLLGASDTAGAVDVLKHAAAASPRDARLWHDYGMLLSAWNRPWWRKSNMPAGIPQRFIAADSALARAMWLAPDSAKYALHYGEHLFMSNQWNFANAMRVQAYAMDRAEGGSDTLTLAQSRDALGLFYWRRFETVANRRFFILNLVETAETYGARPLVNRDIFDNATREWKPPLGEPLYIEAANNFRRARELNIEDELAFRHEAMLLAFRARWDEMADIARARIRIRPSQTWPWLALGVAEHRRGRAGAASTALDSGFARLPQADRERLSTLTRLLSDKQRKFFDTLNVSAKQKLEQSYFSVAAPTLLEEGSVVWDEFRARLAFSELMWTNEQMDVRGADSDRAEVLIRYGPPDNVYTLAPDGRGISRLVWLYRTSGFMITFETAPTYGTANLDFASRGKLEQELLIRAAAFDNLPLYRNGIDSIPVQLARFRKSQDTMDVAVFAGIRLGRLRAGLPVDTSVIKTGVFSVDDAGGVKSRTTDVMRVAARDTLALSSRSWRTTVPTSASYVRVEALNPDAARVARAIRDVTGFPVSGFGVSDLVIGTGITAPANLETARWSDYRIAPITGDVLRADKPLDLLWEVYAPSERDGNARYRVSITVQRAEPSGLVGVASRISGRLRNAIVRTSPTNRVAVEYERSIAPTAVRTESLRLDLSNARAGRYLMTLEISDLHSGATAITHRDVVLVDR